VRPPSACAFKLAARAPGRWGGRHPAPATVQFGLTLTRCWKSSITSNSAAWRLRGVGLTSTSAPRLPTSQHQKRASPRRRASTSNCTGSAPRQVLDVGAGLASTTRLADDFDVVATTPSGVRQRVWFRVKSVCDEAGVRTELISRVGSGRWSPYHSLLVFDVLGVPTSTASRRAEAPTDAPHQFGELSPSP